MEKKTLSLHLKAHKIEDNLIKWYLNCTYNRYLCTYRNHYNPYNP